MNKCSYLTCSVNALPSETTCYCFKVWLHCNSRNARAERVLTSSTVCHNANYVKMFFINFILAEHVSKFVFELISVEIAFV